MWTLADKYNVLTPERAARELLVRLKPYEPFIFKKSVSRSSVYVHFRNLPNKLDHKLRISNHNERERYGYKWQLHINATERISYKYNSRYYRTVDDLVDNFIKYYDRVEKLNAELLQGAEEQSVT